MKERTSHKKVRQKRLGWLGRLALITAAALLMGSLCGCQSILEVDQSSGSRGYSQADPFQSQDADGQASDSQVTGSQVSNSNAASPEDAAQVQNDSSVDGSSTNDSSQDQEELPLSLKEPSQGGQLSCAMVPASSYLPWDITDRDTARVMSLIYEGLFVQGPDARMQPLLVSSYEFSDEGDILDLYLNMDICFQDGTNLDAGDVVYSIEQLKAKKNFYSDTVSGIDTATVMDTDWVRLTLKRTGLDELTDLTFPIVSQGYQNQTVPMGTGPYRFDKAVGKREIHLAANETYHGTAPYIPTVIIYLVADSSLIEQCFATTRTNMYAPYMMPWGSYGNDADLDITRYTTNMALYLEFNTKRPFASSLSNRQKTAYALNASDILKASYWGKGLTAETLVRPDAWYMGYQTTYYAYDPEKARDIETENTNAVVLLYKEDFPMEKDAADMIKTELEAAGLTVTLTTSGDYDIALRLSEVSMTQAADMVGLKDQLQTATLDQTFSDIAHKVAEKMGQQLPVYNLFYPSMGVALGAGVHGQLTPSLSNVYNGIEDIYMDGEGQK